MYQSNNYHVTNIIGSSGDSCKSCSKHLNCSSCLHTLSCGWCYDNSNPIIGVCVSGSFKAPHAGKVFEKLISNINILKYLRFNVNVLDTCSEKIQELFNQTILPENIGWSYAQCPDVNECLLKLDNCHSEAICTNTDGSYSCECKRGFYGDGRHSCIKTYVCTILWCVFSIINL